MKVQLLSAPSSKEPWFVGLTREQETKISRLIDFQRQGVGSPKFPREQKQLKINKESELFLAKIHPRDYVVLLDEGGKAFDSIQFSQKLETWLQTGKDRLVFVVGGAFGVSSAIRERADFTWSLSALTMNHLLAEALVLEQIYRALCIQGGLPYHNP